MHGVVLIDLELHLERVLVVALRAVAELIHAVHEFRALRRNAFVDIREECVDVDAFAHG